MYVCMYDKQSVTLIPFYKKKKNHRPYVICIYLCMYLCIYYKSFFLYRAEGLRCYCSQVYLAYNL